MTRCVALCLVVGLWVPSAALPAVAGRKVEITPMVGYRVGGSTREAESGAEAKLQGSPAYGVLLDVEAREDGQYELLYTHQSTDLESAHDSSLRAGAPQRIDTGLAIDTVQVGGLLFLAPREERWRPYMAMTLGVSVLEPEDSELAGGTYFSGSLAGGVKLVLSDRLAARIEVRGHGIFVSEDSEVACSSGSEGGVCFVGASGGAIWQLDASVGLALSF